MKPSPMLRPRHAQGALDEACQRLARTRLALLRQMHHPAGEAAPAESTPARPFAGTGQTSAGPSADSAQDTSAWPMLRQLADAWWQNHPAHLLIELAQPVFHKYARAHPIKLLGMCAASGAALVWTRPWRLVSLGGLLKATLQSNQVSNLAAAVLKPAPRHPLDERTPP